MLFSKAFAGLALLSVSAQTLASPTPVDWSSIPETSLTRRAPLADIPVCVDINLNNAVSLRAVVDGLGALSNTVTAALALVANIDTFPLNLGSACLCLGATAASDTSVVEVRDQLLSGNGLVGTAIGAVVGIANPLLDSLSNILGQAILSRRDSLAETCPEPFAGEVLTPAPAGTCQAGGDCPVYSCPANLPQRCVVLEACIAADAVCCPAGQKLCGDTCIPEAQGCVSGIPQRKRSILDRSRYACRLPLTACPVSHFLARDGSSVAGAGFECLDTRANIESCGGCVTPFRGNKAGQDCTAIANADGVTCAAGTCIVESCVAGFKPSADASACEAASSGARFAIQGRK